MRLIDADVAEKMLRAYADEVGCNRGEYELANWILKAVSYLENIPTVYDVDKVVEQLREQDGVCTGCRHKDECNECSVGERIDIVKGGGLNE